MPSWRWSGAHDAVADADAPAGILLKARDHAQRRRLAAAGRSQQRNEFAALDLQVDAIDGDDVTERAAYVFDQNCTHPTLRNPTLPRGKVIFLVDAT